MHQALSDITVVEIGREVAAGWCDKVFADLGADVVKIELPDGDPMRADRGMFSHLADSSTTLLPLGPFPAPTATWLAMMMTPQQLPEMLDVLDSDELRAFFAPPDRRRRSQC